MEARDQQLPIGLIIKRELGTLIYECRNRPVRNPLIVNDLKNFQNSKHIAQKDTFFLYKKEDDYLRNQ